MRKRQVFHGWRNESSRKDAKTQSQEKRFDFASLREAFGCPAIFPVEFQYASVVESRIEGTFSGG
jgi:hypothetical protein